MRPKAGYGRPVGKGPLRAGGGSGGSGELEGAPEGRRLRIGIVVSRFNGRVTENLLSGALEALKKSGVQTRNITIARVPGAFEIPLVVLRMIRTGRYHGIVALGAVIRGETPHFEYISASVSEGLGRVALETGVPVGFGVLTTNTQRQAMERAGVKGFNQGTQAALTVLETVNLLRTFKEPASGGDR